MICYGDAWIHIYKRNRNHKKHTRNTRQKSQIHRPILSAGNIPVWDSLGVTSLQRAAGSCFRPWWKLGWHWPSEACGCPRPKFCTKRKRSSNVVWRSLAKISWAAISVCESLLFRHFVFFSLLRPPTCKPLLVFNPASLYLIFLCKYVKVNHRFCTKWLFSDFITSRLHNIFFTFIPFNGIQAKCRSQRQFLVL